MESWSVVPERSMSSVRLLQTPWRRVPALRWQTSMKPSPPHGQLAPAGVPHPAAGHASLGTGGCSGGRLMIPSGLTSAVMHRARPLTSAPGRGPHRACSVLRAPAGRELLDGGPLSADAPAHRATRVAPDLIERTAPEGRESWTTPGGSVSAVGGHGRQAVGTGEVSRAGSSRTSRSSMLNGRNPWLRSARLTQQHQKEEKWVYIGNLD